MDLTWHNKHLLGELLLDRYDTINPQRLQLDHVRRAVLNLERIERHLPETVDEQILEAIHQVWCDRWKCVYGEA
jgi:FeS assembly protein IscX